MASGAGASSRGGSSSSYGGGSSSSGGGGSSSSGGGGGPKRPPSPPNGGRPHAPDPDKKYHKVPEKISGFPDAKKMTGMTPDGMGGVRKRWELPGGRILEWDKQHGDLEMYTRGGRKHIGSFDPVTGEKLKPAVTDRTIRKYVN